MSSCYKGPMRARLHAWIFVSDVDQTRQLTGAMVSIQAKLGFNDHELPRASCKFTTESIGMLGRQTRSTCTVWRN